MGLLYNYEKFCEGDIDEHMDTFLDVRTTNDAVIESGIATLSTFNTHHAGSRSRGRLRPG